MKENITPIRFLVIQVTKREWEDWYYNQPGYTQIWRKKTMAGISTGATLLVKVADVGNWRELYLTEHQGYKCAECEDTGVEHLSGGWIPCPKCAFGENVKRYAYQERALMPELKEVLII